MISPQPEPERRPLALVLAAAVLALQAVVFGAFACVIMAGAAAAGELVSGLATTAFIALIAVGASVVGLGLWRLRRWARGPAVAWSLLVVLIGASQLSVNPIVAIGIIVIGLVGAGSAAAPSTRAALTATQSAPQ